MPYTTTASALATLKLLNPRDAIAVLRKFTEQELTDSDEAWAVLKALDGVEEDLFPADPEPCFVSSDGRYAVFSRAAA